MPHSVSDEVSAQTTESARRRAHVPAIPLDPETPDQSIQDLVNRLEFVTREQSVTGNVMTNVSSTPLEGVAQIYAELDQLDHELKRLKDKIDAIWASYNSRIMLQRTEVPTQTSQSGPEG